MMYEIPKVGLINLKHVHIVTHPKQTKDNWQGTTWRFEIQVGIKTLEVKVDAGPYSDSGYKDANLAEAYIKETHKGLIDALYALNVPKVVDSTSNETDSSKGLPRDPYDDLFTGI